MAEGGALGKAGGARRVLDVDGVGVRQARLDAVQHRLRHLVGPRDQLVPAVAADVHDAFEVVEVVSHLVDHLVIVAALEGFGRDQRRDTGLVENVLQLVGAVAGVDVDEDGADLRGGVLGQRPLRAVRRPDADPVTRLHPDREQRPGQIVDVSAQLGVGPPLPLRHVDERLPVREAGCRLVEVVTDGGLEQRGVGLAMGVGEGVGGQGRARNRSGGILLRRDVGHRLPPGGRGGCGAGAPHRDHPTPDGALVQGTTPSFASLRRGARHPWARTAGGGPGTWPEPPRLLLQSL